VLFRVSMACRRGSDVTSHLYRVTVSRMQKRHINEIPQTDCESKRWTLTKEQMRMATAEMHFYGTAVEYTITHHLYLFIYLID
jgi:hypothetical protein